MCIDNAGLAQVKQVGDDAAWRSERLGHWDVLERILRNGQTVSPLLQVPWVTTAIFRIDWLHCADQGISADFLGNAFLLLSRKCTGRNKQERTNALWAKVQEFYRTNQVADRLQNLVPSMLQQPGKAPKLRSSAAQCRALVPFADACAKTLLSRDEPLELAVATAAAELHECYKALSSEMGQEDSAATLRRCSQRFAEQYVALNAAASDGYAWRCKPKLHLFLELCMEGSRPSSFWNYRDEDFGGSVARMARRRGGVLTITAFSTNLLRRFKLHQPVIRMTA